MLRIMSQPKDLWMSIEKMVWGESREDIVELSLDANGFLHEEEYSIFQNFTEIQDVADENLSNRIVSTPQQFLQLVKLRVPEALEVQALSSVRIRTSPALEAELVPYLNTVGIGNISEYDREKFVKWAPPEFPISDEKTDLLKIESRLPRDRTLHVNDQEWLLLPTLNGMTFQPVTEFAIRNQREERAYFKIKRRINDVLLEFNLTRLSETQSLARMSYGDYEIWESLDGVPGHCAALFLREKFAKMALALAASNPYTTRVVRIPDLQADLEPVISQSKGNLHVKAGDFEFITEFEDDRDAILFKSRITLHFEEIAAIEERIKSQLEVSEWLTLRSDFLDVSGNEANCSLVISKFTSEEGYQSLRIYSEIGSDWEALEFDFEEYPIIDRILRLLRKINLRLKYTEGESTFLVSLPQQSYSYDFFSRGATDANTVEFVL